MYNSIIDFIENDTTKIKKILEKYLFAGNTLRFEEDLMRVMIEFGRKIYQECLKEIEENIRQSEFRKKNYYVEHKADRRTLLTTFGNLEIERAYYKPKNGGKSVYLLDKYVGLAPHDKVSLAVKTKFVEEAVETSYQKGGEKACMTEDVISKMDFPLRYSYDKICKTLDIEPEIAEKCGLVSVNARAKKTEENINAAAERDKAIMRMHDEGISARQIAKILKNEHPEWHICSRTVDRLLLNSKALTSKV